MKRKPKTPGQENYWGERAVIRTHRAAKDALAMVKIRLRGTSLRFRSKSPTEEAIFATVCLWMNAQDPEALAAMLAPHAALLEALLDEDGGSPPKGGGVVPVEGADEVYTKEKDDPAPDPTVPTRAGNPRRKKG